MRRPPRDIKKDRLVDGRLLRYSYLIVGLLETGWCLLSFFTVFAAAGVPGSALWNSFRTAWSADAAPLTTGGRTFTGAEQQTIYYEAVAAYYLTLIACQAWHVFTCKTRYVSLYEHG
jgi:sodium/potassium-transporting ATPase subunit alpha